MTTVGILNDRLCDIEANPKAFVEDIVAAIRSGEQQSYLLGQTTVLPSHHADTPTVTLAYANSFVDLSQGSRLKTIPSLRVMNSLAEIARQTLLADRHCIERRLLEEITKQEGMTLAKAKKEVLRSRRY
jgi:hypothetical protein